MLSSVLNSLLKITEPLIFPFLFSSIPQQVFSLVSPDPFKFFTLLLPLTKFMLYRLEEKLVQPRNLFTQKNLWWFTCSHPLNHAMTNDSCSRQFSAFIWGSDQAEHESVHAGLPKRANDYVETAYSQNTAPLKAEVQKNSLIHSVELGIHKINFSLIKQSSAIWYRQLYGILQDSVWYSC